MITSFIFFFFRIHEVFVLLFPLLFPEVRHHASLQLQLEAVVAPWVRVHLFLRTRILSHGPVLLLVQNAFAHERHLALPALPGDALAHRNAQQLRRVNVLA
jgi:hypothetical protein